MKDCIFCKISEGKIPCKKVIETENFIAFKDIKPKSPGHTLLIPKKHYQTLLDMPKEYFEEFLETSKQIAFNLLREEKSHGFNLLMNNFSCAGQMVPHVHMHIIPRKDKDKVNLKD